MPSSRRPSFDIGLTALVNFGDSRKGTYVLRVPLRILPKLFNVAGDYLDIHRESLMSGSKGFVARDQRLDPFVNCHTDTIAHGPLFKIQLLTSPSHGLEI